jgi:hypothetical protein
MTAMGKDLRDGGKVCLRKVVGQTKHESST